MFAHPNGGVWDMEGNKVTRLAYISPEKSIGLIKHHKTAALVSFENLRSVSWSALCYSILVIVCFFVLSGLGLEALMVLCT